MRNLVPGFILEKYQAGEMRGSVDSASLFVDLSGFSKMADVLAQHSQIGAETLTEVMRLVFDPLVNSVYSQGGFVVGYAGDSFTAIFPGEQAEGHAMRRSLAAALAMQEHVRGFREIQTRFGKFPITIKVGLGSGVATWQIFTSADRKHATYCIRGESVRSAVIAEECAQPGIIVIHESVYHSVKDHVDTLPVGDCFQIVSVKSELPTPRLSPDPEPAPDIMGIFVPDEVLRLPIVGEFRQIVNVFIDIPKGISDEALMAPFMETVYALQERYGGFFLRPDFGDKGFNLLMFWGAPTAHETDIVRAINFVLELVEKTRLDYRVGITYRTAYSGFMGASLREDYTAYGWGLNLAARLMEHAGRNEIWLDEEVARRADAQFDIKYLDEFVFKGFARRQKTYLLHGRKELLEKVYQGEIVGRRAEMEILSAFLEPLREGMFAGMMIIQGDAGIGKSRLIHTFQSLRPIVSQVQWIIGQTDEILPQSFGPFRKWLKKRFGYLERQSVENNLNSFDARLRDLFYATTDPDLALELLRTSSMLAALLNLHKEGSLYEQLDAKGRYENTLIGLSALLHAECLQRPLVLVIEDLHWLDDDTRTFLAYLIRSSLAQPGKNYPLAIIGTQRPGVRPLDVGHEAYQFQLKLGSLTSSDLSQIAGNMLGHPVRMELLELLLQRSDGNPFFAEQILHYLLDNDMLFLDPEGYFEVKGGTESAVPTDVNALLIARLDSLADEVRKTVQTASVLGREFEVRLLAEMLRGDLNIYEKVTAAERHGIWVALDEIQYIFRHALLRDAAYSMQLLVRQQQLHKIALAAMETLYAGELETHYGELAFHAEHANLVDKALEYLIKAGKVASELFQNSQAVDYYTRALTLTSPLDSELRIDLMLERSVLFGLKGDRHSQGKDLDSLEALASGLDDNHRLTKVWMLRSEYLNQISEYQSSIEYSIRVISNSQSAADSVIARAYTILASSYLNLSNLENAMQSAREGAKFARQSKLRFEEGKALTMMGLIAIEQNETAHALEYNELALSIAREIQISSLEGSSLINLANALGFLKGEYSLAIEYYNQAHDIFHLRGDRSNESLALSNLGWVAGIQGDFVAAQKYYEQALQIVREVGNIYIEIGALINLSALSGMMGKVQEAMRFARDANGLSIKVGDKSREAWSLLYLGNAYLLANEFKQANEQYQRSRAIREELGQATLETEPVAGLIQAALGSGDITAAKRETEWILAYLTNGGTLEGTEEPLRVYFALYRALVETKDPRSHDILNEAKKYLETQVSKMSDAEARTRFVENVPWRLAIRQAG